jgi:triphosphatase
MEQPRAPIEVELKLLVPPDAVRRLSAHRLLKGRLPADSARLYAIYFDTPDFDLWGQGVALRVRREGKRWIQCVKAGGPAQGGLHERIEAEDEVAGPAPEYSRVRDPRLAQVFASADLRARIEPAFITDFQRSRRLLEIAPGAAIEASIDRGEIRCGKRVEAVSELELELKGGAPQELYDCALRIAQDIPLALENRSKAERGIALARKKRAKPAKVVRAALHPDMPVGEAFRAVADANLSHLLANERGMLEGAETEYLHQMRVAVRRLRSALDVFSPPLPEAAVAPVAAGLKWLAGRLGPARDWDVFVRETLPPVVADFDTHGELQAFCARCEKLRRAAGGRARAAVRSLRYRRITLSTAAWLAAAGWLDGLDPEKRSAVDAPLASFAKTVLDKRYRQVRRRGRRLGKLSAAQLHRLRIAVKKLRYGADFFAGLYEPAPVRRMAKRLARLQDILGAINDGATAADLVARGFERAPGRGAGEARGILLGWNRGRAGALKRDLGGAWRDFRAVGKYW